MVLPYLGRSSQCVFDPLYVWAGRRRNFFRATYNVTTVLTSNTQRFRIVGTNKNLRKAVTLFRGSNRVGDKRVAC